MQTGIYRHYKGRDYEVLGTARHSETEELFVIYRPCYGEGALWIRPKSMFEESVTIEGEKQPRFALIEPRAARLF